MDKYMESLERINNTLCVYHEGHISKDELLNALNTRLFKEDLDMFSEIMFLVRNNKIKTMRI